MDMTPAASPCQRPSLRPVVLFEYWHCTKLRHSWMRSLCLRPAEQPTDVPGCSRCSLSCGKILVRSVYESGLARPTSDMTGK